MLKIGLLFGQERSFPEALIEKINGLGLPNITAEKVHIDAVVQGKATPYAVILDRISQDVPFYRAYLKNASLTGTYVVNNPFWWSADEKFFNNCLATKIGVPVPNTVILPSHQMPAGTTDKSFSNLAYPLDWEGIFEYIGFPAYMKPHSGGGWKNVYCLKSKEEFFEKYAETNELVMLLQEEIKFTSYFRCYCVGGHEVRIMPYEPRNPHHLRYVADFKPSKTLLKTMKDIVLKINHELGYDLNTVELAVRDGIPYAIDFCNPAPDADLKSVGEDNFKWIVDVMSKFLVDKAKAFVPNQPNIKWGNFIK
ncbi:MAG: hypothetical protein QM539_01715 [Alphaproteobacteria bacterium]|nr:hypothetical protein [Alphaproteobacteria bacterium]